MRMELNRAALQRLFDEDIEWLLQQPRTLERDHIEAVLRNYIAAHTKTKALTAENNKLREACEAAMQPVKIIKTMYDEGKLKYPDGWATPSQLDAAFGKE